MQSLKTKATWTVQTGNERPHALNKTKSFVSTHLFRLTKTVGEAMDNHTIEIHVPG